MTKELQTGQPALRWLKKLTTVGVMGIGTLSLWGGTAKAADIVNIQFLDLRARLPVSDLETFAADGIASPALTEFLEQTPIPFEALPVLLDGSIPDTGIPLGRSDIEFLLFQLNKIVGNPSARGDLLPLAKALQSAYLDRNMSMLELIKRYPDNEVRFDIRELGIVYRDVNLFVERLTPIFNFFSELLPDLVCECDPEVVVGTTGHSIGACNPPASLIALDRAKVIFGKEANRYPGPLNPPILGDFEAYSPQNLGNLSMPNWENTDTSIEENISQQTDSISSSASTRTRHPVDVTFDLGPLVVSISTDELKTFVETGELPRSWPLYTKIAGLDREEFRNVLVSEFELNLMDLDGFLHSLPGEYALFQLGRIAHTPSRRANIQALRAAILLSAADDNKGTLLEILKNYPARQLVVDTSTVARFTRNLNTRGAVGTATASIEDLLVEIQNAIAAEICDCDSPQAEPISGE